MSDPSGNQVVFPNETEVDIDVFGSAQMDYEILKQYGFYFSTVNEIPANYYKVGITLDPSANNLVVPNSIQVNPDHIFDALKTVNIGYLGDLTNVPDAIETNTWESSTLTKDTVNVSIQPDTPAGHKISEVILNGIIGPMFTGVWGSSAVEISNRDILADSGSTYDISGINLDDKITKGLTDTLENASLDAHDEILNHLVNQVIDTSNNEAPQNIQEALQYTDASGGLGLNADGNPENVYRNQNVWMKVYLDVNLNEAVSSMYLFLSPDYQQELQNVLGTDDDDLNLNDDEKANLVKRVLSEAIKVEDLNETFLSKFKGQIVTQDQSSYGVFDGPTEDVYDYSEGETAPGTDTIKKVRVPFLIKFKIAS